MRAARTGLAIAVLTAGLLATGGTAQAAESAATGTSTGCWMGHALGTLFGVPACAEPSPDPAPDPAPGDGTGGEGSAGGGASGAGASGGGEDGAGNGSSGGGSGGGPGATGGSAGEPSAPVPATAPPAPADADGLVFTAHPATLTGDALGIEGLRSVAIVTVDLADGSTARALKIEADRVTVDGFGLDVPSGDGGLANTATTLDVSGHVVVWTPSITAVLADGASRVVDTLSAPTPESLAGLLRLRLPLLGLTADRIAYDDSHQAAH